MIKGSVINMNIDNNGMNNSVGNNPSQNFQDNNMYNNGAVPMNNSMMNNQNSQMYQNNTFSQAPINNNVNNNNDELLLRSFIGNNYEKIVGVKSFNFPAFFLTSTYLLYRKMFLYGILCFIIELIILNFFDINLISLGYKLLIGIFINKFYINHAKSKISNIKMKMKNCSFEEISQECAKKGGTSIIFVILGITIQIIMFILFVILSFLLGFATFFSNLLKINNEDGFNGMMFYDTDIVIKDEYSIEIPDGFSDKSNDYSYEYVYSIPEDSSASCEFSMNVPKEYSDASDLINQMADYYSENEEKIETEEYSVNDIKWYWFSYEDVFGKKYYYATTKDDKVYLAKYESDKRYPDVCEEFREDIISSIKENLNN